MGRKILLAGLYHETHCFVPDVTRVEDFTVLRGDELLACAGDGSTIDGFLEVAHAKEWSLVPAASYSAMPSGIVEDAVFEAFWRDFEKIARPAIAAGIDGILLSLHGAMVTRSLDDPEGELLQRTRAIPGAAALPIFGVFDLHASFTQRMAQLADCLVAYRENPHIDAREAAVRTAELLDRTLSIGRKPRMLAVQPPILWPPTGTGTANPPMSELEALARDIERAEPDIWVANVVGGFAFADVADAGVAFSAATVGDPKRAHAALERLAAKAVALRERGIVVERPVDDVLAEILPVQKGPVLLVEPSDNIGGGAPGDCTGVLRALLRNHVANAAVVINDPDAVQHLQDVEIGSTTALAVGGRASSLDPGPVTLEAQLISRSDGRFTLEDRHSHLAAMQGVNVDMGRCAVIEAAGITILLTSRKTPPFDLGQLRSQGIEPTRMSIIAIKAAVAHRRAYDPIAAASYWVLTPGPCTSDLKSLPYRRIRRPIFPLDPIASEWG
jgi:microcystin degradation protein MlrC